MHKIRLRFSKHGTLRFIGHLDFLRVFQQTVRRAALPAAFSQGFNPHLLISFALPLPLGMTSANDYADITLAAEMPPAEIIAALTTAAPPGLTIHAAYPAENKAAAVVCVADYFCKTSGAPPPTPPQGTQSLDPEMFGDSQAKTLTLENEAQANFRGQGDEIPLWGSGQRPENSQIVQKILERKEIIIPKKTKKGVKDTDIRGDILGLEAREGGIFMRLSAGSARFLNPLTVAGLISDEPSAARITRLEMYREDENGRLAPL